MMPISGVKGIGRWTRWRRGWIGAQRGIEMGPRGTLAPDMACLGWVSSALRTGEPGVAAVLSVWVLVVTLGGVGAVAPSAAGHCSTHRFDGVVDGSERSGGIEMGPRGTSALPGNVW